MPPPPDPSPPPPTTLLRTHPLLPAIWALQVSSLLGLGIALFFFARIQSDDGDSGDHILAAILQLTTLLTTTLLLLLTLIEPPALLLPLKLRGYLLLQALKLAVSLLILGFVLRAVRIRWREGWRPGPRELGVGVGCGGAVLLSFAAGVTYAGILVRKSEAVGEGAGETAPLLGNSPAP